MSVVRRADTFSSNQAGGARRHDNIAAWPTACRRVQSTVLGTRRRSQAVLAEVVLAGSPPRPRDGSEADVYEDGLLRDGVVVPIPGGPCPGLLTGR